MTREQLLSSIWVRMLIFAWMIIFPIIFIALPLLEIFINDAPSSWTPVWALMIWMTGPWVVSIVMKMIDEKNSK
ncbi:MAG: hypothetical protein AAF217_11790 [Pseudomonadota bacterium]